MILTQEQNCRILLANLKKRGGYDFKCVAIEGPGGIASSYIAMRNTTDVTGGKLIAV
jgi:hypothetical protein